MNTVRLTDQELWQATNALRVAAVQYATDADTHADTARLHRQFLDQATLANALADKLECAA